MGDSCSRAAAVAVVSGRANGDGGAGL